jgi:hypothetical protein
MLRTTFSGAESGHDRSWIRVTKPWVQRMDSGLLPFLQDAIVTMSEPMNWTTLVFGLALAACGSRDDGRPGREPASADMPSQFCERAGERRCNGADRQVCTQGGDWELIEACDSAAACEVSHCNEAACQPSDIGTLRCTGSKWLGCTDGKMWQTVEVCDDVFTCCADE